MGENSAIEWTTHTFNPWVGCTKISPGCDNCYAEGWAKRSGLVTWGEDRRKTSPANWRKPLRWNAEAACELLQNPHRERPRVFCASLADVFDNDVPLEWRTELFRLIYATPNLDWLLLTKRIGNVERALGIIGDETLPPNVWLGITVVNQEEADRDIPKLLRVPAAVRFLSCEPLLELVSLDHEWLVGKYFGHSEDCDDDLCALNGDMHSCVGKLVETPAVHWVIVGGESGSKAREMNPDWARYLREQCRSTGAAFFMKQMTKKAEIPADLLVREFPDTSTTEPK